MARKPLVEEQTKRLSPMNITDHHIILLNAF